MSVLRSLATFVLTFLFVSTTLFTVSSYTIGKLVQKESIKDFIKSQIGTEFINQQCQDKCKDYSDYKEACTQICISELANQTESGVDKTVNEIYQQKFFDMNMEQLSLFLTQTLIFAIIAIFTGILMLVASKTPILTLGKSFLSISISLFVSSLLPQFLMVSINLPFNLSETVKNYFSSGFNQQMIFGIIFLISGIALIIINYVIGRKRKPKEEKPKSEKKEEKK